MEISLAIVVTAAVLFFGALISAGNERQRRAIDALREQAEQWEIQDLRLKRERLAREIRLDDPLGWLNDIAAHACGYDLRLQVVEAFENPPALLCSSENGNGTVVFTPLSPTDARRMRSGRSGRLSRYGERHPLWSLSSRGSPYSLSILNSGALFDLELTLAWKSLTGQSSQRLDRLWMYVMPVKA
jgi:hypothetical protein